MMAKSYIITEGHIPNGYALPYLDGMVYVLDERLYYWENGVTSIIALDAFRIVVKPVKSIFMMEKIIAK